MPVAPQTGFPTVDEVTTLWRAIVNDTFPGVGGNQGRICSNDAPFTLPFLNSAFRTLQRKLRLEGVTFPIIDGVILQNLTPVVTVDSAVQVYVGFDGYYDGTVLHATPKLPSNFMQPLFLWEQTVGTGFDYQPMSPPNGSVLPSVLQGPNLCSWEWRTYRIYMVGATMLKNLRLRYQSGQPPLDIPPADFATTAINILDCQEALANMMAAMYGRARGANPQTIATIEQAAQDAVSDMAEEYVRQAQGNPNRRIPYGNGGSGSDNDGNGSLGQSGVGN
jgi:hypothetical protein